MDAIGDKVFSELFQAKAMIVIFGILGVAALIGTYWNPSQLFVSAMCAIMVLCGLSEYRKLKRKCE